jgi:hypothetical protein
LCENARFNYGRERGEKVKYIVPRTKYEEDEDCRMIGASLYGLVGGAEGNKKWEVKSF